MMLREGAAVSAAASHCVRRPRAARQGSVQSEGRE